MRHSNTPRRWWWWLVGMLTLCGCAPQSSTAQPIVTPTLSAARTATPQVTSTPIMTPSGNAPGWTSVSSANWSGYTLPPVGVTGVRAQWTEPQLSGTPDTSSAIWVGIGGWDATFNDVVQVGVRPYLRVDGTQSHRIWYETLPPNSWHLTDLTVAPGDAITASVTLVPSSTNQWQLALHDTTSGVSFAQTVTHTSARSYADIIVEDPNATTNNGPPYYAFTHFSPITFTSAQVNYGGGWVAFGHIAALQVRMVQNNATVAQPGPLVNDTFTVQRGS
ncbi:MAG: hypothetical protein H0X24_04915 [Ktedonobacterales bacterium]|nr:hypothetical protein [Ktedonobacterales bacterium]